MGKKIGTIAEILAKYLKLVDISEKNRDWEHVPRTIIFPEKISDLSPISAICR